MRCCSTIGASRGRVRASSLLLFAGEGGVCTKTRARGLLTRGLPIAYGWLTHNLRRLWRTAAYTRILIGMLTHGLTRKSCIAKRCLHIQQTSLETPGADCTSRHLKTSRGTAGYTGVAPCGHSGRCRGAKRWFPAIGKISVPKSVTKWV
jgi:hypothetical protein